MFTNKRFLLLLLLPVISLGAISEEYESGKTNIMKIMSHEETGISAYNKKNIHYAETLNLYKDLNIPEIAKFFPCKTEMGRTFIAETLSIPVNPQDRDTILAHRQQAIRTLIENPTLKKDVEQLLENAKQHEETIIELMSDFFKGKFCPEIVGLKQLEEQKHPLYKTMKFILTEDKGRSLLQILQITGTVSMAYTTGKYMMPATLQFIKAKQYDSLALKLYAATLLTTLETGLFIYMMGHDYKNACNIRSKLHSLNQLISTAEQFEQLCKANNIQNQFNISALQNKEGINLINALKHNRYRSKNTFFFRTPKVQTFLYDLYLKQRYLAETFACIAEIDAYNAIATKIIESEHTNNQFCFATYLDHAQPVIQSKSFWNVLVNNAVPSSISEDKHIILSGPNAGGKTTAIRAILQNIVLAQTFGIAAAESFELTMFDVIHSYLNISDDLLNGLSLFASEIKRAQDLLGHIKSLDANKKLFFALDELFTGTVAEDGETCAYEFVNKVSVFSRVQFIYATHFEKLKELAKANNRCINYKVDAPVKDDNGKLVYPYTLSQGASDSRVAITLAQQAGLFN